LRHRDNEEPLCPSLVAVISPSPPHAVLRPLLFTLATLRLLLAMSRRGDEVLPFASSPSP